MSESDFDGVTGGMDEVSEENSGGRMVPVTESIRYRKRAQGAEQRSAMLEEELSSSAAENKKLKDRVGELELERKLIERLAASGVNDMEAALLMAKNRLCGSERPDVDDIVRMLKAEKGYLFGGGSGGERPGTTLGARTRKSDGASVLERAAKRAAASGARRDLQEYLRLRRGR